MLTRSFYTSLSKLCLYLATAGIVIAQYIPDHQARILDELDHIFVDIGGRNDAQFASVLKPCSQYFDIFNNVRNDTFGRQTSAQWIRAAFRKVPVVFASSAFIFTLPIFGGASFICDQIHDISFFA